MAKRVAARAASAAKKPRRTPPLTKAPTGIQGLDELTGGGLPKGRPTLLCGSAGCGKTLMAMEFLVRGALDSGEPGVFMAFEESGEELATNFASLGHDLSALIAKKKLVHRIRPHRAQRDGRDGRVRPGRALHPAGTCHRQHRRQARGARHPGGALLRAVRHRRPTERAAAPVPLAEGPGHDGDHHRRKGRRGPHPPWPGGIRRRLRDRPRPPRGGPDGDAAAAHRQVQRVHARHERVSVPHRRGRHLDPAHHVRGAGTEGGKRPRVLGRSAPGLDDGGQGLLSGQHRPGVRNRGLGEDEPGGAFRRGSRRARRALPLVLLLRIVEPDHPQHALHRHRPGAGGAARDAAHRSGAVHDLGPGDAPRHHPQAGEGVQAERGHHRPGLELSPPSGARRTSRR